MPDNTTSASPKKRQLLKRAGLVALVLALGAGGAQIALGSKKSAPEVTFTSLSGEKITTSSLRGKVVMVNFWATSCETCVKEMPQMIATYQKYKDSGLSFVAVAMAYDPPNYVLNYAQTRQLPFTVALDVNGSLAQSFGNVVMTPTTFVIGKDGKIIKRYVGEPVFSELHALLDKALRA